MPKLIAEEQSRTAAAARGARPARTPSVTPRPAAAPVVQKAEACACGGGCPRCEGAAKGAGGLAPAAAELVARADASAGAPLPADVRGGLGRLGADLSGVRVHTGAESAEAARAVGARAYTVGQRIHFAEGQYDPASGEGRRLLAHEVVHTLQQGGDAATGHGTPREVSRPGDASEREADSLADALAAGGSRVTGGAAVGVTGGVVGAPGVRRAPHLARQPNDPQGATGTTDPTPAPTTATAASTTGTTAAAPSPAPAAPTPKAEPWEELFPHVHAKDKDKRTQHDRGITKVVNEKNKAPQMEYVKDTYEVEQMPGEEEPLLKKKNSAPAPGPDEPSRTDNDPVWKAMEAKYDEWLAAQKVKRDKAISEVLAARKAIPARDIGRDPQGLGNFYDPTIAAKKEDPNDPYYMGDEQAAKYNAWLGGAKPTTKFDATNDDDKKKWQIFQKMIPLEGRVGTVTTFDKTLTIGVGFSSAGTQAEQIIVKLFNALPSVREAAYAAGLSVKGKDSLVVLDTEQRWILEGFAAANYVQTQPALLSLIVNTTQGVQPDVAGKKPDAAGTEAQRQAMVNAQWDTFLGHALKGIPAAVLGWPIDSVALAVHSRHMSESIFPWSFWEAQTNTAVRELVRAIYLKLRSIDKRGMFFNICNGIYDKPAREVKAEEDAKAAASKPAETK